MKITIIGEELEVPPNCSPGGGGIYLGKHNGWLSMDMEDWICCICESYWRREAERLEKLYMDTRDFGLASIVKVEWNEAKKHAEHFAAIHRRIITESEGRRT